MVLPDSEQTIKMTRTHSSPVSMDFRQKPITQQSRLPLKKMAICGLSAKANFAYQRLLSKILWIGLPHSI